MLSARTRASSAPIERFSTCGAIRVTLPRPTGILPPGSTNVAHEDRRSHRRHHHDALFARNAYLGRTAAGDAGLGRQTVRTEPQRTLVKCTEITTGDA
jgi:hypothetical protein